MSERESGFGSFILGVTVGVVLGLLFAPEPGEEFRGNLGRRLAKLRDLGAAAGGEQVEGVRRLLRGARRARRAREDEPEV